MKTHPGHTMSLYDLPGIVKDAATNAQADSRYSGIWPLNRDIFSNQEYAPSRASDRPCPPQHSTSASQPEPLPQAPPSQAPRPQTPLFLLIELNSSSQGLCAPSASAAGQSSELSHLSQADLI